jgi:hypothetical protein
VHCPQGSRLTPPSVFHEVGRIDELPKFPYPEVGVDNDGVLVGRGENGSIGLLICSFLEPLRV